MLQSVIRAGICCAATAVGLTCLVGSVSAGTNQTTRWLTGGELRRQLAEPVGICWSATPLRKAVVELCRIKHVAVLIDRRVDPDQRLELVLEGLPLEDVLERVALNRGLGVCLFGPVTYLGPQRTATRLRTVAELRRDEVRKLSPPIARRLLTAKPARWNDFATPRELLAQWSRQSGLEILGLDLVPHDLWAAADLPPLAPVDRLTLIVGQFDLTFEITPDRTGIKLVPVPDDMALVRSYPGGRNQNELAKTWAATIPDSQTKVVGNRILVRGLLEDHERITRRRAASHKTAGRNDTGEIRIEKLTVKETPLNWLLPDLAGRLKVDLKIDRAAIKRAGISLKKRVTFSVEDATIDELFRVVLTPAGLTFARRGNTIEIRPAE